MVESSTSIRSARFKSERALNQILRIVTLEYVRHVKLFSDLEEAKEQKDII